MHHRHRTIMERERLGRPALAVLIVALLTFALPGSALAAPPANESIEHATVIVGNTTLSEDTTEATTDAAGAALAINCSFPPVANNGVWFTFTTDVDELVDINVFQSTYSAGILLASGTAANPVFMGCNHGDFQFIATGGTTYFALAFGDDPFQSGGGTLNISFTFTPVPTLALTIDPTGTFDSKTGAATVSGTYTCTLGSFIALDVQLAEKLNRKVIIRGFASLAEAATCDAAPHPWSVTVPPGSGAFGGGTATVNLNFARACFGPNGLCGLDSFVTQTISLKGGK